MEIPSPENRLADQSKAIEGLQQGFEIAKQLKIILSKSSSGDGSSSGDLLETISNSFSYAISVFGNAGFNEVNLAPGRKLEDSEGSSKSTATVKDRRGCYKRRRTEDTWTTETPNWVEDGRAWRKYGQKVILNCKYPRNYYRCTHKSDGCPATKQVQQIRDNPPLHRTTYHGKHTCGDLLKPSQILVEDHDSVADSSVLLRFDNNGNLTNNPFLSSSLLSVKQEHIGDHYHPVVQCDLTQNQSSSSHYIFSPDELTAFGSSLSSDHADVISCTASTRHYFDMGSIDHFEDDVLQQCEFES